MRKAKRTIKAVTKVLSEVELKELVGLKQKIKDLKKRAEAFEARIKETGSFSTKSYVVVLKETPTETLRKADVIEAFGAAAVNPLLNYGVRKTIDIAKKGAAK